MEYFKKLAAEFIGTALLVFFGCGIAMRVSFYQESSVSNLIAIALGFGFVLIVCIYMFGKISGCHINPAVSFAMLLTKRMDFISFLGYIGAQFLGGIAGAGALALIAQSNNSLGANVYGALSAVGNLSWYSAVAIEVVLTFAFVLTVLIVTSKKDFAVIGGVVNGLSLSLVHLFGVLYTGTSVNPARSFGPALFASLITESSDSMANTIYLEQVWVFLLAPMVGAAIAAGIYCFFTGNPFSKRKGIDTESC